MQSQEYYKNRSTVKVGEIERYIIKYNLFEGTTIPQNLKLGSLHVKVKNLENLSKRAAYLIGPYSLYCDIRTSQYHHNQHSFITADQPKYELDLQPQRSFNFELQMHKIRNEYVWILDVVSQIIFTTNASITFDVLIWGDDNLDRDRLTIDRLNTLDLWNLPRKLDKNLEKEHLVILAHGLHSNLTADMFYLKEQIEQSSPKIIVQGYAGNVCKTEKGVKYLGTNLAEYIVHELYTENIRKISFVGHSLGGLIQTFAIAYIGLKYPTFFSKVEPINFITLSSPLLGVVTDNPAFVQFFLSVGIVGKTGQDLGLKDNEATGKPLLTLLPCKHTRRLLKKFKNRTVYANSINDGIVPLYTSALMYLDYDDILQNLNNLGKFPYKKNSDRTKQRQELDSSNQYFITKSVVKPISKAINLLAPQWQQPNPQMSGSNATEIIDSDSASIIDNQYSKKLPKSTMLESAANVLLQPVPSPKYIYEPKSRENVIIHDKVYAYEDIKKYATKADAKKIYSFYDIFQPNLTFRKTEEEIAKKWHKGLTWRKVVVALKSDAHNNIFVRRRFPNGYGWPVIDHLVEEHFLHDEYIPETNLPHDIDIKECEESIEGDEDADDLQWLTSPTKDSLFDVGPTGMISTVGEFVEAFTRKMTNGNDSLLAEDKNKTKFSIISRNGTMTVDKNKNTLSNILIDGNPQEDMFNYLKEDSDLDLSTV
ncbi:related to Putative lipase ROG1 [Saccharomycodes ludwigii]|uniref:Related to Putative lipase ROG1 n=1 Tax=Saccharomycodes ludwigii TaxID=36035 RepID=A0A376B709_9ASCO|nr:hypothetical protein SCDLUD_002705 [Saccharomycodes ludwigii]KAH3901219.1 hypothetical protein SCDLUD_002705 [Saccharomycodes ludwigii]SSD60432.1 related to Putative lipase ROG1 [Saccharomycodes ludwigii]